MYNFYIIFGKICNFFQISGTPGGPWGAPPRGYPTWVTFSNNLNILRFWNILEQLFRNNKQKKRDQLDLGVPPGQMGGCFGGVHSPGGAQGFVGPVFFACYVKIIILRYSRNVEYSNYYWKVPMWGTPLGGPPRGPCSPPRGPRVSQRPGKNCKNSQKLYKKFTCINIPQIITLMPILSYLDCLGGPKNSKK